MSDHTITLAQIRAAYDALGLEAERFGDTKQIVIKPHAAIVTRHLRDSESGRLLVTDGEIAQEFTVLRLGDEQPVT